MIVLFFERYSICHQGLQTTDWWLLHNELGAKSVPACLIQVDKAVSILNGVEGVF